MLKSDGVSEDNFIVIFLLVCSRGAEEERRCPVPRGTLVNDPGELLLDLFRCTTAVRQARRVRGRCISEFTVVHPFRLSVIEDREAH